MKKTLKSFGHAASGIIYALKGRNFKIQALMGVVALFFGLYLRISRLEFLLVIFLIGFVLALEATNTAIEEVCNKFHPETHPHIALIKDLAAGAVLIAAIAALAIGLMVFVPYLR